MNRLAVVMVSLSTFSASCDDYDVQRSSVELWTPDATHSRWFLGDSIEVLWTIGTDASDTTLLSPRLLVADSLGVTVWDDGRMGVTRISSDGTWQWTFGNRGEGPGEFRSVSGMAPLPDGGVVIADAANGRLTLIDKRGDLLEEIGLKELRHPASVAALANGDFIVYSMDASRPFVVVGSEREVVEIEFPWSPLRDLLSLERQGRVVAVRDGWVFGLTTGNGWWHFSADDGPHAYPYAEHTEFPVVATQVSDRGRRTLRRLINPVYAAWGLAARGDTLFVHFAGRTEDPLSVVDLFLTPDGSYLGSIRFSAPVMQFSVGSDRGYIIRTDVVSSVSAIRRVK